MLILNVRGKITPDNDKTNLIHHFDIPENIEALKIKYCYSPKVVEDREKAVKIIRDCFEKYNEDIRGRIGDLLPVKNLVTLSLDCNGRYIGAAHRQANEQEHIISAEKSSAGFVKTEIEAGEWTIMLNVHSVNCDIDYTIEIEGVEKK